MIGNHAEYRRSRRFGRCVAACCIAAACGWSSAAKVEASSGRVRGYFEVGRTLVENGQPRQGLVYVAVAVALSPTNVAAQTYLLALLDRDCCRTDLGLHETLHTVLPTYRPVTERLALLHERRGGIERAGALHLQAAGLGPQDPGARERLATYYAFVGRSDLAQVAASRRDPRTGPGDPTDLSAATGVAGDPPSPEAPRWNKVSLEPDAETGDRIAMFVTGRKYIVNGSNASRKDWVERGIEYLDRSARAGFTAARRFLGALYLDGELVPRDITKGVAHYERAAAAGDVIAQRRLADMYFNGEYVSKNRSRAVFWYQTILHNPNRGLTAYKSDDTWEIELRLASLYEFGDGVEKDPARARALLEHAARTSKAAPALEALAVAFEKGLGGEQRNQHALMMYAAAARGYLERGYQYGLNPRDARREATAILDTMERIQPEAGVTRHLRARLTVLSAAP